MSKEMADEDVARERRFNSRRNVAVVGLRDIRGRVLLVRTTRLPNHWQPIGGGMATGDADPTDTIIRKAAEEVGVKLRRKDLRPVLNAPYDFGVGTVYFFQSLYPGDPNTLIVDRSQIVASGWVSIKDAVNLPMFRATELFISKLLRDEDR